MAMWSRIFAVALIVANVLVPERIVSYRPCCLDENGRPLANCHEKFATVVAPIDDCCAPIHTVLRDAPPSDSVAPDVVQTSAPDLLTLPLSADVVATSSSRALFPLEWMVARPPGIDEPLLLYCCLNL